MPFKLKDVPPTYQQAVSMAFEEYFCVFMKLLLNDFNVFNDLKTHLAKLQLCFDKCQKFGISFNSKKCIFLVSFGVILGYIMFKERKLPNPKKIVPIVNMSEPKTLKTFKFSMAWCNFIIVSFGTSFSSWPQLQNYCEKLKFFIGLLNVTRCEKQLSSSMWMHRS
jgi:hypothetical protein